MKVIVPAIMPRDFHELKEHATAVQSVVDMVQIDIMDGSFVSGITWPFPVDMEESPEDRLPDGLPFWEHIDYELDLMVHQPEDTMPVWLGLGPASMVIHLESVRDWEKLKEVIENSAHVINWGISFSHGTDLEEVEKRLPLFSYLQCMGIDAIGAQGQPFSEHTMKSIQYFHDKYPDLLITVDGSVNRDTIVKMQEAGAGRFVAGSAIFAAENPLGAISDLAGLLQ